MLAGDCPPVIGKMIDLELHKTDLPATAPCTFVEDQTAVVQKRETVPNPVRQ
jgi:hypothetical protein